MRLFASVEYTDGSNLIAIELSSDIRPYLFQLKSNFDEFELEMVFNLRSYFAKRIYEILSRYKKIGIFNIAIEKLKYMLEVANPLTKEEKYREWSAFENNVLKVAKPELEEYTDIAFTYKLHKTGRKYTEIEFHIRTKPVQGVLALNL